MSTAPNGKSDHRLRVTEVGPSHDRNAGEFGLGLDELSDEFRRGPRCALEPSDDDPSDATRLGEVQERLQVAVEFPERREFALLKEEDGVREGRHVFGPLEEVQRAEIAADDRPLGFACVDSLIAGIRDRMAIDLVPVPLVIGPDRARLDIDRLIAEEAAAKHVKRVVEVLALGEVGVGRTGVGHNPRLCQDGIAEDGDVRETGEGFRIPTDELPVDVTEKLIARVATDDSQDEADFGICERRMEIVETRADG